MIGLARVLISRLGDAALKYAEKGWHVFPLTPRGKQPIIARGFLSASVDPAQIRDWWRETPDANIGLWPGRSNLLVIDIDGPEGEDTARALGILAEPTLIVTTGRPEGGRHLYFRHPGFNVSNCNIGRKLDVRGDAGYVILPPSVHPSGKKYQALGKLTEIRELPPDALEAIRRAQLGILRSDEHRSAARDIALQETIGDGERNNTLTRYAGRLLAKGMTEEETLSLVSSMNRDKCSPALPQSEVNALVANIGAKESQKRAGLSLVTEEPAQERDTPRELAEKQIAGARAMLTRDLADAPTWAWSDLRSLLGPMVPGDFLVVGSQTGNGKSTFLMSQMDYLAIENRATLYLPLEVDSEVCRLRWASWKLGFDPAHVITQEWQHLPEGARESVECVLEEQVDNPFIHFLPPKRIRLNDLAEWCKWGKEHVNASVVMIDHLHRMDISGTDHRVAITDVVRRLKDLARELELVLICSAQLNRGTDPFDSYLPPGLHRLKESAGIAEEADVVLMLSRRLKPDIPPADYELVRKGFKSARDVSEPNVMSVMCRKHRLRDAARDVNRLLIVNNGRLEEAAPAWREPPPEYQERFV